MRSELSEPARAEGQIVGVAPGDMRHHAPFQMRWRNPNDHQVVKTHVAVIATGDRLKLILADYSSGGDWGKPSLEIIGDTWVVDVFRYEYGASPVVTLEVTISSQPGLSTPFRRRYEVQIPKNLYAVKVRESTLVS